MQNLDFIGEGIKNVYKYDEYSQKIYLTEIMYHVRDSPYEMIKPYCCVFIPNEYYLEQFFPHEILNPIYGFYNSAGRCLMVGSVLVPILSIRSRVIGYFFFSPSIMEKAKKENDYSLPYYRFPRKEIFSQSMSTLILPQVYKRAIKDRYIIFVDGTFDVMNLTFNRFWATGFLGSYIKAETLFIFRFIENHFLWKDNDEAGIKLEKQLKKYFPNMKTINQGRADDCDNFLKYKSKAYDLVRIREAINFNKDVWI